MSSACVVSVLIQALFRSEENNHFCFCILVLLFPAFLSPPSAIFHAQLCHTQLVTHNIIFHTPSLSHHLSHTQLCHTPSFTHNFVTHPLSHTIFVNHLCHTPSLSTTFVSRGRHAAGVALGTGLAGSGGTLGPVLVAGDAAAFCVASVANGDIHLRFTGQAWHLATTTFVLRGRRGTYGTGLALVARLGPFWSSVTRYFAWQAWHLGTSTFVSRGRLRDNHFRFAWQAGHLWHWAGSDSALGAVLVAGDAAALCVAGVALGDIHLRFAWQAWHLATTTFVLRVRRGTCGAGLVLVARLGPFWSPLTPRHFAWQAWCLATCAFVYVEAASVPRQAASAVLGARIVDPTWTVEKHAWLHSVPDR